MNSNNNLNISILASYLKISTSGNTEQVKEACAYIDSVRTFVNYRLN